MTSNIFLLAFVICLLSSLVVSDMPTDTTFNMSVTDYSIEHLGENKSVSNVPVTSPNRNCRPVILPESVQAFQEVFSLGVDFMRVHMNIINFTDVSSKASKVFDETTLIWALEGKGYLLLTFPTDFNQLSFWTLSPGVLHINIDVELHDSRCFQGASSAERQLILVQHISDIARIANSSLTTNAHKYAAREYKVCVENVYDVRKNVLRLSTAILAIDTIYSCWPSSHNATHENAVQIGKQHWLYVIRYCGYVLGLFSPLIALFLIEKNPLKVQKNDDTSNMVTKDEKYLAIDSDLPLGLKHFILHSYGNLNCLVVFRYFIGVFTLILAPWMRVFMFPSGNAHTTHSECSTLVMNNLLKLIDINVAVLSVIVTIIFFASSIALLLTFICQPQYRRDSIKDFLDVKEDEWNRLHALGFVELDILKNVPPFTNNTLHDFLMKIKFRTLIALNPSVWKSWPNYFFKSMQKIAKGRKESLEAAQPRKIEDIFGKRWIGCFFCKLVLRVILLFLLIFVSVPLIYVSFTLPVEKILDRITHSENNRDRKFCGRTILVCLIFSTGAFLLGLSALSAFAYVSEVIAYTLIGLLVNSDVVGKTFVVVTIIACYVINISSGYYDTYRRLINVIMKLASSDEEVMKKVIKYIGDDQIPRVSMRLFTDCINQFRPFHLEIVAILLKLCLMVIVLSFAMATIASVSDVSRLPALAEYFLLVIIARTVPFLQSLHESQVERECREEGENQRLLTFLREYTATDNGNEISHRILIEENCSRTEIAVLSNNDVSTSDNPDPDNFEAGKESYNAQCHVPVEDDYVGSECSYGLKSLFDEAPDDFVSCRDHFDEAANVQNDDADGETSDIDENTYFLELDILENQFGFREYPGWIYGMLFGRRT